MIAVENLRKSYGTLVAVDGISFSIAKGEVFGLLGPNGAGKTTTISLMVGAISPDSGRINIDGQSDPSKPELRRQIGFAPQSLAVYGRLTAAENLSFFGSMYGLSGAHLRERVDWALEFARLTDRRSGLAVTFSGGMLRRLNLACALVHDPPVLFLDEPTVGVDPQSRNLMFDSVEKLKAQGRTMIYTTHYMEEAERLCDRVAIIDHGKLLALDTVRNLTAAHGGDAVIDAEAEELPPDRSQLPGTWEGNRVRLESKRPIEDLARLSGTGLNFKQVHIQRPSLEKVFLNLTGRSLRDE
jgi:ABC-2 type transport system ATP-binding protein